MKSKDTRLSFNNHRITHEGSVWHIDAKADPATGRIKVYRVYGDVTDGPLLREALQAFADTLGSRLASE